MSALRSFVVTFHTDDYRGDHAADVTIAVEPRADETVAELIERASAARGPERGPLRKPMKPTDYIVIRLVGRTADE